MNKSAVEENSVDGSGEEEAERKTKKRKKWSDYTYKSNMFK